MEEMSRKIPFLTSSIINCYVGCKYDFWKTYIDNNGYETYREDDESGEAIYLTFGKLIHGCIEQFWKSPKTRTREFLYKTYEHDIVECGITDKSYHDLGYTMLDNFFDYCLNKAPKRKALHSELGFNVTIGGVPFHGHIDQVFYHGDGIYEIEDYKTSKWIPTQEEVDENIQLTLYDLVFSNDAMSEYWFHGIKPKVIILTLHFLREGVTVTTERTPYTRVNALSYFRTLYRQMLYLDDSKFYPSMNIFCGYCDNRSECPLYQSVIEDEYDEPKKEDYEKEVEYYITMSNDLNNRIKILNNEKSEYDAEIHNYFSKNQDAVITCDGYDYFMAQNGRRYVKTDLAIKILEENGLWNPKDFINSLPIGKLEKILSDYPDVWDRMSKFAIGFNYYNPSLQSRKSTKLFAKPKPKSKRQRK